MSLKPPTVLIDIDGTIIKHHESGAVHQWMTEPELLPGVFEYWDWLEANNATIILVTARYGAGLEAVLEWLSAQGLFWHNVVAAVSNGPRILINDMKRSGFSAIAMTVERNGGLESCMRNCDLLLKTPAGKQST